MPYTRPESLAKDEELRISVQLSIIYSLIFMALHCPDAGKIPIRSHLLVLNSWLIITAFSVSSGLIVKISEDVQHHFDNHRATEH